MGDWTKWALGIVAFLFCASVVAVWRLVAGKADKTDIEKDFNDLHAERKAYAAEAEKKAAEVDKKFEQLQAEGLRQYRELRTAIEGIQKELNLLDKHSLTSNDLTEMKADIKDLVRGTAEAVKLIDGMPDRLTSLEATRNKQSEK